MYTEKYAHDSREQTDSDDSRKAGFQEAYMRVSC